VFTEASRKNQPGTRKGLAEIPVLFLGKKKDQVS